MSSITELLTETGYTELPLGKGAYERGRRKFVRVSNSAFFPDAYTPMIDLVILREREDGSVGVRLFSYVYHSLLGSGLVRDSHGLFDADGNPLDNPHYADGSREIRRFLDKVRV